MPHKGPPGGAWRVVAAAALPWRWGARGGAGGYRLLIGAAGCKLSPGTLLGPAVAVGGVAGRKLSVCERPGNRTTIFSSYIFLLPLFF